MGDLARDFLRQQVTFLWFSGGIFGVFFLKKTSPSKVVDIVDGC